MNLVEMTEILGSLRFLINCSFQLLKLTRKILVTCIEFR